MRFVVLLAFLLLAFPAAARQDVMRWSVLVDGSRMTFAQGPGGTEMPIPYFDPEIVFEPGAVSSSRIVLRADLTHAFLPPKTFEQPHIRDALAIAPNTGNVSAGSSGAAIFTSEVIERKGNSEFVMSGVLSINGNERRLAIPFSIETGKDIIASAPRLVLSGAFSFNPNDYAGGKLPSPGVSPVTVRFRFATIPAM